MDPITFGALTFGANALGSIGSFFGQQDQVSAQNKAAVNRYRQQLQIHTYENLNRFSQYNRQKAQYSQQLSNNAAAANDAFMAEDMKLNELFKAEAFNTQANQIEAIKAVGTLAASGQTGQSAARAQQSAMAAFGRNQAVGQEQLRTAVGNSKFQRGRIRDQLRIANDRAYANVAVAPDVTPLPLAPTMRSSPSPLGLFTNLAGDALGAFNSYKMADANW